MKHLLIALVFLATGFVLVLNTSILAGWAAAWVGDHPKDPDAPEVLYRVGRWCDIVGNNEGAQTLYLKLVQQYPKRGDLCAPALYYTASDIADGSYIIALRKQAIPYLRTILDQYSDQANWKAKAQKLDDELENVH